MPKAASVGVVAKPTVAPTPVLEQTFPGSYWLFVLMPGDPGPVLGRFLG